ncbi:MAG: phosphomannomutase/phosphoglucomutase [bacterium]
MKIEESIFKKYDIRGIADTEITDEVAELLGKAYGTIMKGADIIIGRDTRESSDRIFAALTKGLMSCGCKVIDIGETVTPVFYYARVKYETEGGMMITASHNSAEYNGFKIGLGEATMHGEEIQNVLAVMKKGEFLEGKGSMEKREIEADYLQNLKDKIKIKKKMKVVVDCGNGTASLYAEKVLKEAYGMEVVPMYCDIDPSFPNHEPDPVKEKNLQDLVKKVKEEKADIGLGFDGDADRLGVVDNEGNIIWGDMMLILFFRELLAKYPGELAIIEVKCSQSLVDDVKAHGGKPMFYKTGHSHIKAKMLEENAKLTGEMSGHMFFRDEYYGFDDAYYAAGRLLRILAENDKSLTEMLSDAPKYYATQEYRLAVSPESRKNEIVAELVEYFKTKYEVEDVDGARVLFGDGWGLVRVSNTQPAIIFRAEGTTPEALEKNKKLMLDKLREYKEIDFADLEE